MRPILAILIAALSFATISLVWLDLPMHDFALRGASEFWHLVSLLGKSDWMLAGSLLAAIFFTLRNHIRRRNEAWFILSAVALSGIAVQILKAIIGRARPTQFETLGAYDFQPFAFSNDYASMPSGHATSAFAFAVAVAIVQPALRGPMALFAIIVSYSRLPEGMHYLSDITLGAALGSITTLLIANYLRARNTPFSYK